MNNPTPCSINRDYFRSVHTLALLTGLFALMNACAGNHTGTATGRKLRLGVGDIKEVTMTTPADTSWQLTAASDNQEIVDVSRKPLIAATGSSPSLPAAGPFVFLIKGVTAGTANVVFTEKKPGTDGNGRVKKAYVVTVTSK